MLLFRKVLAAYVTFERGGHVNLAAWREICFRMFYEIDKCIKYKFKQSVRCKKRPKWHKPDKHIEREHPQSSWRSTRRGVHQLKSRRNNACWAKPAERMPTFILGVARVLYISWFL